jgi:hypothetical protein
MTVIFMRVFIMPMMVMAMAFMFVIVRVRVRVGILVLVLMTVSVVRCAGGIMFHSRGHPSIDRMCAGA